MRTKKRFEDLSRSTKGSIASSMARIRQNWGLVYVFSCIPPDIRPRKVLPGIVRPIQDKREDNPQNWTVGVLQDLGRISSLTKGDVKTFQRDLRRVIRVRKPRQPWAKPEDIKGIRIRYESQHTRQPKQTSTQASNNQAVDLSNPTIKDRTPGVQKSKDYIFNCQFKNGGD